MYLISIYFDAHTNKIMQQYINQIAKVTGNSYMLDGKVPPHITISAFETEDEEAAITMLAQLARHIKSDSLQWVSVGAFLPYVICVIPVLNEYLHTMSSKIYDGLLELKNVSVSRYYRPFQWFPHTTVGKKLTKEQLNKAFVVMQNQFGSFEGRVTHIGLAKTNPYRDVAMFEL